MTRFAQAAEHLLPSRIAGYLESRPGLRRVVGNSLWLTLDRLVRMGVGLVVGVWVARYLGPSQYGALSYALAFVALFGSFASLGLDGIVVRDIVRRPEETAEIVGTAFALKLGGGILAVAAVVLGIVLLRPGEPEMHLMVGIIAAGMIFQSLDAIDLWFQSHCAWPRTSRVSGLG